MMKASRSWSKRWIRIRKSVLTVLLGSLSTTQAAAADIYVATNGTAPNDGSSWAAAYTNIQSALNAASNGDTIHLAGHRFVVTQELIWTSDGISVRGGYEADPGESFPGANNPTHWPTTITRSGGTAHRLLKIDGADNSTLEQVALSGGSSASGSALLIAGSSQNVRIYGCAITGNTYSASSIGTVTPPAIHVDTGTSVIFSNCVVRGNTGANSSGGGNAVGAGGGLYVLGSVTVLDSRILDNVVTAPNPRGGGVYVGGGTLTMRNVLVAGNQAAGAGGTQVKGGGGIYVAGGTVDMQNVTVADNVYEGIRQTGGTVAATNSIVWFNSVCDATGTVTFAYSNVGGHDYGGNNISADPLFTVGYYLDAGSPSTNAGSDTATSLGLAGYAKNADGDAYGPTETVNQGWHAAVGVLDLYVSPDGHDANDGDGPGPSEAFRTVGKALATARDNTRIHVATGTYSVASGEVFPLTLNDRVGLTIIGTNRQDTVLDAAGSGQRVATLSSALRACLQGITLTGGRPVADSPEYGGGIYLTGRSRGVLLSDCAVTNNSAGDNHQSGYGGGIAIAPNAEISADNVLVSGNVNNGRGVGNGYGGGFYNAGTLAVRDAVIRNNSVPTDGSGGGLYNSGIVDLRNVLLAGNAAQAQGDGLYIAGGAVVALNCTVANNAGEGMRRAGGTAAVTNSILWGNGVDSIGGVTLAWTCYENSTDHADGGGNLSNDPLFVDTTYYHLQSRAGTYTGGYFSGGTWAVSAATSPCIDTGNPASDYSREPQPNGRQVNLGAYGNTEVAAKSVARGTMFIFR